MAKRQDCLPSNLVHKIKKSVTGWDDSDIRTLLISLCDSHERLRHALYQQDDYKEMYLSASKRQRAGRRR